MNLKFYPNSIYSKTVAAIKLLLFFCTLFVTSASLGGSGIYQTYVIINKGTGNEYYGGGINSQNATAFNGLNLGSFCPTSTLLLNGGEVLTFKNGISDVFGANIFYRVYSTSGTGGSLTQIDLPFTCQFPTNPCPGTFNNGDQKWARTAHNVNVLSGLTPGTYFLEVYWNSPNSDGGTFDSNFGANFKATFTVLPPALSATVTPVSCFGGNNGAINLTASCLAGLPPVTQTYEQNFNSLASSPTNTNITWTDNSTIANWYTNRLTYRVSNGSDLTGSLYSFGSNSDRALGSIASGATGQILGAVRITNTTTQTITSVNVNYFGEQWRNGGNTTKHKLIFAYSTNATDDNAGTYIAFPTLDFEGPVATSTAGILDGNLSANRLNISGIIPVTLAPGQSIWLRWADADDTGSDHGLSIDDLTVTLSSAGSGFGYSWTGPNGFTAATEDISGLVAGNYTVTVTGSNGSATATYSVTQPNAIVINESVQQVSCNGGNNGAINITVTGGTGNLTYSWSNGATSEDISNLTAGIYTITVKDGNNCSLSKQITVTQPSALSVSVAKTDASCFGGNNGSINLTVTGGTSPYTFTWSNNASSEDISSLVAGNYSVLVSDANGCTATANVTINQPAQITISANALNSVLCKGGNTTITAATNNATIFWQQSANGTSDWTNVPACNELYISEYVEGSSNLKAIEIYNGTGVPVDLSAGNYQLKFYFNGSSSPATVISLTGILAPNDVYVIADDNSGAAVLASADQISTLSFFNGDDAIALTKNNNNIDVIGQIGVDPGTQWGSGSTGTADHTLRRKPTLRCAGDVNGFDAFDPSLEWDGYPIDNIENLGSHLVHFATGDINSTIFYRAVYSKTGCADVVSNTVQITVTDITVTVTPGTIACNGGTTAVTVSATGGTAPYTGTGSFNVGAGTYTYTVTDANGCSASTTITVIEPAVLSASSSAGTIACNGGTTAVTVSATGGTAPYIGTGSFNVGAGTYTYTVTDANGCSASTTITVIEPAVLSASSSAGTIACNGGTTAVTVSATGGTAPYIGTGSFNVGAGTYTYTVTDANGCSASTTITVIEPAVLSASSSAGTIACNGGTTAVTVSATGGTAPYTGTGSFNVGAGTYTYTVTDANGCSASTTITVIEPAVLSASSSAGTIACNGGTTAVTVSATGGTAPYTGTGSFNVGAGTYTYTVTDANGCSASTTITVIEPAVLNASASAGVLICPSGTVNVTVNASGGTAPYTGTGNFTRGAGTHHFTVTDANGCTTTTSITINATNTAPVLQSITPSSYAPVAIGTSIGLSINYNDPNNNVTTAAVNWDDGSAIQIVNNPAAAFTLNRTYANPGVYSVTVTLTDACGLTSTARYDYVVVFDPTGGFVTGGGWINSPAGALADNPLLTGRANFGFVAKYKKGSNVPDGNTEFQFQAGNFNFKSMEYDAGWLVISGSKATFRGSGTVNGSGNFGFLVVAVDGQISGGGGFDKFRIKIWDKSNGNRVVYDNDMGMDDNGIPSTAIAGGSIVIHNPKKSANTNLNFSTEQPLAILPVSFNVKVLGNPTLSKFVLKLESDDMNTPMTIKVVDVSGRILEVKQNIRPGQLVEFGTNYKLGTYFAEVVQGEQRKVVQLIKIER